MAYFQGPAQLHRSGTELQSAQCGSVLGSPEGQSEDPGLFGPGVNGHVFCAQTLAKPGCVRASGQDAGHTSLQFLDPSGHLLFFLSSLNTIWVRRKEATAFEKRPCRGSPARRAPRHARCGSCSQLRERRPGGGRGQGAQGAAQESQGPSRSPPPVCPEP